MAVCLVTHARFPIGEPRAERAARAAREAGYEVHVICLRGEGEPERTVLDGISIQRLPMQHQRGRGLLGMFYEYVGFTVLATAAVIALHWRRRLAVVQVHAPPDFLVVVGLVPRLLGVKLVLDIRDLSPHMWDARFGEKKSAPAIDQALRFVERAACGLADDVVTVHEPYRDELVRHGVQRSKVTVVMNTPDDALVRLVAESIPPCREERRRFTVGYHGTITTWYGVDILVRGMAAAHEKGLSVGGVIVGEGDALPFVRRLADQLGVADFIEFSGSYLPMAEALRIVAQADCGVIPNPPSELNRFILSNKLFEYVALGIPVVVARLETVAAHFSDEEVTFFEAGDAEALAAALRWVATHPDAAAAKAERAQERATAYSWHLNRERYLSVLEVSTA